EDNLGAFLHFRGFHLSRGHGRRAENYRVIGRVAVWTGGLVSRQASKSGGKTATSRRPITAAPEARQRKAMNVVVLGSATPYPGVGNPCSGYLVRGGGVRVWVDAGTGTLGALLGHVGLGELDAVWVSHLHADHCADLLTAYYGLLYADVRRDEPLPLYGPVGIADRLAGFLTNGAVRSPVESAFAVTELRDGLVAEVGGLTLTSGAVSHGMEAFALRVEGEGRSLVYSGDSAPCAALTGFAQGCDVLLCEADSDVPPPEGEVAVHHTPEEAGETAHAAGAGRLVVTHVGRAIAPDAAVERAARRFGGPVEYAAPGLVFEV
ncbi:MBL fold metallo-hydrolase, partial [Actinocorallia sp. A-T 12471]|uniref:MBL fold metallo-hydrolase n=1 Tax=Actinocorallia sp. A-T 12471 TaxID=3089813 RepID=UPI0029CCDDF1